MPNHSGLGIVNTIKRIVKSTFGVIFKFAIKSISKLFLYLDTLKIQILDFPEELRNSIKSINTRSLQSDTNQICNQMFSLKYFKHLGIFLVFILMLINNAFAGDTNQLGDIEFSFESQASAKFLTNSDLVNIVKTLGKYTLIDEKPEDLPENLSKNRKIIIDQKGFIVKPVLAMNTVEVQQESTTIVVERRENIKYSVQTGDSLGGIADNYNLKISTLKHANNLSDIDVILPGQTLLIPFADGMIHTVKAGETLLGVVKRYRGDFQKTLSQNNLNQDGTIYIGQKIVVVGGEYIPPKPQPRPSQSSNRYADNDYSGPRGNFRFPTSGGTYYNGYHWWAIDIPRSTGTPIYASDGGRVVTAGWNSGGYGRYIVINHGNGYSTLYAHLSSIGVGVGQYVNQGQYIGGIGSTGRSSGSHLHFEIILNGRKLNPIRFF
ncbi:MAG: M23 family metallopeptidase [bacterium]